MASGRRHLSRTGKQFIGGQSVSEAESGAMANGEETDGPDRVEAFLADLVRRRGAAVATALAIGVGTIASVLVSWAICVALGYGFWGNSMAVTMPIVVPLIVGPPFTYVYLRAVERLDRLAVERQAALAASRQANQARLQFLANVSHELRTPLNAVIGFSEILENQAFGPLGHSKYRDYAKEIKRSGSYLLDLVNDLLTISEITSSDRPVDRTTLHARPVVRDILAIAIMRARDGNVRLRVSAPRTLPRFIGNRQCVRQILLNLLGNAFKVTPPGKRVVLIVTADEDGRVVFEIRDEGPGIPKKIREAIGRPFLHTGAKDRSASTGFGLGLSIVKSMCDAMDAEFSMTDGLDGGAIARISFPGSSPSHPPTARKTTDTAEPDIPPSSRVAAL